MDARWPPPPLPPPSRSQPAPEPPLTVLRAAFHFAYMTLPAHVWSLPLRQQSDEVLRAVIRACRCITPNSHGLEYMRLDPEKHRGEYYTIMALASVDADDWLDDLHRLYPDDPYPAQALDPDGRWGKEAGHA